jgi:hypothetical protein
MLCQATKNLSDTKNQCLFQAETGKKYCGLHLSYENVVDYVNKTPKTLIQDKRNLVDLQEILNPIFVSHTISPQKIPDNRKVVTKKPTKSTPVEQKTETIINTYQDNENELEVKLLIMINDEEHLEKLSTLIGPVFNDPTISEDQQDPVTMDQIWKIENGIKVANANKYYLFSYFDSKSKIRCFSVFSLYEMLQIDDLVHPLTTEPIPPEDIVRARELIDLYDTKLNLFQTRSDLDVSPEHKLKNRINKLFRKFHVHSIYFEESWLLNIADVDKLLKIIKETGGLIKSNLASINRKLKNTNIFTNAPRRPIPPKNKEGVKITTEYIFDLKEYIVDNWEELITVTDNTNNQVPIWIIAHGLSFVVPDVKSKFPNLELMIQG